MGCNMYDLIIIPLLSVLGRRRWARRRWSQKHCYYCIESPPSLSLHAQNISLLICFVNDGMT
jgi:hypothetical protein